jgi:hypothetical protein
MSSLGPVFSLAATIGSEVVRRLGEVRLEQERRKTQIVIAAGAIIVALISGIFIGIDKYRDSRKRQRVTPDPSKS